MISVVDTAGRLVGIIPVCVLVNEIFKIVDPHEILREVEWPRLFFFIGLFMLVAGVIEVGLVEVLAEGALALTSGVLAPPAMLLLWLPAFLSGIVDNIPYTGTMIPVVQQLAQGPEREVWWWALAIGTDFGGNATIIGASTNVILASLAEREGHPISFWQFFKYGQVVRIGSLLIATVYIWLRYLL